jgi:hypothetical protein
MPPFDREPAREAGQREQPRAATTTLDRIFETFARDAACHMSGEPATEQDLRGLEKAVGRPLPASFRAFVARFGGGLFYQGHEIFGPHRVMIHDIELVPSLTSMLVWLRSQQPAVPDGVLPFHRADGIVHLLDLRAPAQPERIVSLPYGSTYPDLATFLGSVVLPPAARTAED